jgi:hypothetical protein
VVTRNSLTHAILQVEAARDVALARGLNQKPALAP